MNYTVADEAVIDLYVPIERAVLAKYLDAVDPRPADLRTFVFVSDKSGSKDVYISTR